MEQTSRELQKETEPEPLVINDLTHENEQTQPQNFSEIIESEEIPQQSDTLQKQEQQTPVITEENNSTQNLTENDEIGIHENQTEIIKNEETHTPIGNISIFESADTWYKNFVENYFPDRTNNSVTQQTIWGTNLGQPKDYTTYPFFSQPETRQLYIDANIKVIRIFNSETILPNVEYIVDEIRSIGATPIIVTGTERILEYVKQCGTKAIYQVGNEPNYHPERYGTGGPQGYADWYKYLVDQCVAIEPNAKFMTAGIGIWADLGNLKNYKHLGLDYITETINSGAKVDYVAFNYYTYNPEEILTKEEVLERASRYKEIVQIISEATEKPVACTEWNFGQWTVPNHWDSDKDFINEWTEKAVNGMKDCIFSIQWFAQHWTLGFDSPMAMIDSYGNPKPLHYSFKNNTS